MKKEHRLVKSRRIFLLLFLIIITGISAGSMSRSVYAAGRTVQIRLMPCGGEVSKKFVQVPRRGTVGSLPKARRTGYVFTGWYTKKTDGDKVTGKTKVSSLTRYVLYARYEPITYQIRFRKNGVIEQAPEPMTCSYGQKPAAAACMVPERR